LKKELRVIVYHKGTVKLEFICTNCPSGEGNKKKKYGESPPGEEFGGVGNITKKNNFYNLF